MSGNQIHMRRAAVLFMLAVATSACTQITQPAAEPVEKQTLTITGLAEKEVEPDEAKVSFTVRVRDKEADAAVAFAIRRAKWLADEVSKAGVPESKISSNTLSVDLYRPYGTTTTEPVPTEFEAMQDFEFVVTPDVAAFDTEHLGKLLFKLAMQAPEDVRFSNVFYSVGNPEQYRSELMKQAFADAETQAKDAAALAGRRLGSVVTITDETAQEVAQRNGNGVVALTQGGDATIASIEVHPPLITLSFDIHPTWELID